METSEITRARLRKDNKEMQTTSVANGSINGGESDFSSRTHTHKRWTWAYHPHQQRFRTVFRLLIAVIIAAPPALCVLVFILEGGGEVTIEKLAYAVALITLDLVVTGVIMCRYIDHRPFASLGLTPISLQWLGDAGVGFICGAIGQCVAFGALYASHGVVITDKFVNTSDLNAASAIVVSLLTYLMISTYEELAFRGYFILNLFEGFAGATPGAGWSRNRAIVAATVIAAIGWGLYHAVLDNATVVSTCVIIGYGLLFGSAFVRHGNLSVTFGFHTAWNLFETNVFGFANSGMDVGLSIVQVKAAGPEWWTGGAFGPEAGLSGVLGIVAGFAPLFLYLKLFSNRRGAMLSGAKFVDGGANGNGSTTVSLSVAGPGRAAVVIPDEQQHSDDQRALL